MKYNTTVKGVWGWLFEHYELQRSRMDRAILPNSGKAAQDAPAVEVGYGSYTVRVRVYDGPKLLGFVDFDSRRFPEDRKLDAVRELMREAKMVVLR